MYFSLIQLAETVKQLDRVNAFVASNVVANALNSNPTALNAGISPPQNTPFNSQTSPIVDGFSQNGSQTFIMQQQTDSRIQFNPNLSNQYVTPSALANLNIPKLDTLSTNLERSLNSAGSEMSSFDSKIRIAQNNQLSSLSQMIEQNSVGEENADSDGRVHKKAKMILKLKASQKKALFAAVKDHGDTNWDIIASIVGLSPDICQSWYTSNKTRVGKWTLEEDSLLRQTYDELCKTLDPTESSGFWLKVAEKVPDRTEIQCKSRYLLGLDPSIKRGQWSTEEIESLHKGVEEFGNSWKKISELLKARTPRQCRARWSRLLKEGALKLNTKEGENMDKPCTPEDEYDDEYSDEDEED
jgi:hypothetical protein